MSKEYNRGFSEREANEFTPDKRLEALERKVALLEKRCNFNDKTTVNKSELFVIGRVTGGMIEYLSRLNANIEGKNLFELNSLVDQKYQKTLGGWVYLSSKDVHNASLLSFQELQHFLTDHKRVKHNYVVINAGDLRL